MTSRARFPLISLALAAGSMLAVATAPLTASALPATQAPAEPGKPKPQGNADKPQKKADKPKKKPDRRPPAAPLLGRAKAGARGMVSLPVSAESGSRVVVRTPGGTVVTSGFGSRTYTWWTSTGAHSYLVTATDAAGNRSRAAQFSVVADATPPRLARVQVAPGDRRDSRSRLTFATDPGSSYRVLVDGKVEARRSDPDARVARFLDVGNGRHRVVVEVRDRVGNLATWSGSFRVRIPKLEVSAKVVGDPTDAIQRLRIDATPNATRGAVRVPGEGRERFRFLRGRATVRLTLPDGTYDRATVTVRDARGRVGERRLRPFVVDTTAPDVAAELDTAAAAEGRLRAAVTTDPGAAVAWRLVDDAGSVITAGDVVADESGAATLDRDVAEGEFSLAVSATDQFERTTTTTLAAVVAPDPWSYARAAVLVGLVAAGGLLLVILLLPLVPVLVTRGGRARARVTARRIERRAARALAERKPEAGAPIPVVRGPVVIPAQRGRDHGGVSIFPLGLALQPDERILHTTTGQLYEAVDADTDELVLDGHEGEVVVTNRRLVFLGDVTRDWWNGQIDGVDHVSEDRTVLRRLGEDAWSGLGYDDAEVTRLHLEMLVTDQGGARASSTPRSAGARPI